MSTSTDKTYYIWLKSQSRASLTSINQPKMLRLSGVAGGGLLEKSLYTKSRTCIFKQEVVYKKNMEVRFEHSALYANISLFGKKHMQICGVLMVSKVVTVQHEKFARVLFCGLAIFCGLREQIFAVRDY